MQGFSKHLKSTTQTKTKYVTTQKKKKKPITGVIIFEKLLLKLNRVFSTVDWTYSLHSFSFCAITLCPMKLKITKQFRYKAKRAPKIFSKQSSVVVATRFPVVRKQFVLRIFITGHKSCVLQSLLHWKQFFPLRSNFIGAIREISFLFTRIQYLEIVPKLN